MILLTGATGYLGSHILRELVARKYEAVALKRLSSNTSRWNGIKGVFQSVDLEEGLEKIFQRYPVKKIIHTATCYGRKGESNAQILEANVLFPLRLLEEGLKYGVEVFYNTSTSLPEELNAYSRSKHQLCDWLKTFQDRAKIIHIIPEYFYGPNDDDTKFITMLIRKMSERQPAIGLSACTQMRDFFYIDDLVDGFLCLLQNEEKIESNNSFPIGSGKAILLRELVLKVAELMSYDQQNLNFGSIPLRRNEVIKSKADLAAWKDFEWFPKTSLEEGLIKTIKHQ